MDRSEFLYSEFLKSFGFEPTPCQDRLFRDIASFLTSDDTDILVVNGYAGTGKTTAISAVISSLEQMKVRSVLLAPTGRAAKVLGAMADRPARTIHKHIYKQKSVGDDGFGQFSIIPNKSKSTLFVVDEVSLIGIDDENRQSSSVFGTGNLLEDLVGFVRSGIDCRLILIGDAAQLPPVGLDCSPALSKEYMEGFGGVTFSTLETVVRQAGESGILHNATMLRERIAESYGDEFFDDLKLDVNGFDDIERISGGELIEKVSDAYAHYGEDETIILCRSNKRANRYNAGIRSSVLYREESLSKGDKLMDCAPLSSSRRNAW